MVENRLQERYKNGKPKYDLYSALGYSAYDAMMLKLEKARAEGRAMRRELGLIK